jgi:hypothetical protein
MGAGLVCQSFCENQPPDLRLGGFLPVVKVWKSKSLGPVSESGPRAHGPRSTSIEIMGHPPTEITLASGRGTRSAMGGLAPQHITSAPSNKRTSGQSMEESTQYLPATSRINHSTAQHRHRTIRTTGCCCWWCLERAVWSRPLAAAATIARARPAESSSALFPRGSIFVRDISTGPT